MGVVVKVESWTRDEQAQIKKGVLPSLLSILSHALRSLTLSVVWICLSVVVGLIPIFKIMLRLATFFFLGAVLIEWADHWTHLQILFPIGSLIFALTLLYRCSVALQQSEFMARIDRSA